MDELGRIAAELAYAERVIACSVRDIRAAAAVLEEVDRKATETLRPYIALSPAPLVRRRCPHCG